VTTDGDAQQNLRIEMRSRTDWKLKLLKDEMPHSSENSARTMVSQSVDDLSSVLSSSSISSERRARAIALMSELVETLGVATSPPLIAEWTRFEFGDCVIDPQMRTVTKSGMLVELTPRQYELLLALAEGSGTPVSKTTLGALVWNDVNAAHSRTIDQHVFQLRRKLEDNPASPERIFTVNKFGYRLAGRWVSSNGS
jgi:DNA-binding winged helix-turn-helix (wHTH) protein